MKAIEAKKISNDNLNVMEYVEREIYNDVLNNAKHGKFSACVRISFPDTIDCTQYGTFCENAIQALENLGYKLSGPVTRFCAGLDVYTKTGKSLEVYHYRLFCNESWEPIMPRGEVYNTQFTELGWKSFSEIHNL